MTRMTLKTLHALCAAELAANPAAADHEVKIWLPGSEIYLSGVGSTMIRRGNYLMVEGNVEEGSALDR